MQSKTPSLFGLHLMERGVLARLAGRGHAVGVMRALVLSLLISVALSPLLSRIHHVVHPGHGAAAMAAQTASGNETLSPVSSATQAPAERSPLERLFGSHTEGSPACQLLDHSGTADGPLPQVQVALLVLPMILGLGQLKPSCATGPVAFFQARGPPAFL